MTDEAPSPHTAPDVFQALARDAGYTDGLLTPDAAWRLFTTIFTAVRFAVPSGPDTDGLLYQYGVYDFGGEPHFRFDFTRPFALPGVAAARPLRVVIGASET